MKILFITSRKFFPLSDGGLIGSFSILKQVKSNFQDSSIDLVTFYQQDDFSQNDLLRLKGIVNHVYSVKQSNQSLYTNWSLKYSNNIRKYLRRNMIRLVKQLSQTNHYDVVFIDRILMYYYVRFFPQNTFITLIEENIEWQIWEKKYKESHNLFRFLILRSAHLLYGFETKAIKKSDFVLSVSLDDAKIIRKIKDSSLESTVFPVPFVSQLRSPEDILEKLPTPKKVIFTASFDYFPNEKAALYIIQNIASHFSESVTFYLIGKNPSKNMVKEAELHKNIVITGFVPSLEEYFKSADLFLNPVTIGSGINIKMLESLGRGVPILTSQFGLRGFDTSIIKCVSVYNSEEECIKRIQELLEDKEKLSSQSLEGRKYYESLMVQNQIAFRKLSVKIHEKNP
jgi:polysaccharide biosynthesis protein PslH